MIRNLLIISAAGLVLAVAGLGGAAALGGRELARNGWNWSFIDEHDVAIPIDGGSGGEDGHTRLALPWTGETLILGGSLDIDYVQGPASEVVVEGPRRLAERIVVADGRIDLSPDPTARGGRRSLRVVLTAPSVNRFELHGSGDLDIRDYDQPDLTLILSGSGDAEARGRAQTLDLSLTGSGDADLDELTVETARVRVRGSGDAEIAPRQSADVSISGSGDVRLANRPVDVISQVSGSGRLRQN
jgi:hypothetical protein